jgi:hypothetical protein
MNIGRGTEGQKYADNLAAIRTLKTIEAENRRATPEEKGVLARYVGWGGLKNAFRVACKAEGEGIGVGETRQTRSIFKLRHYGKIRRLNGSCHRLCAPQLVLARKRSPASVHASLIRR